jgi:8-oxo-dGTP pyrophosphatase MutT (NUDIX family)
MNPSQNDSISLSNQRNLADALAALSADDDYARGALDVLRLLGLVEEQDNGFEPAGEVSAMFIHSLLAHLRDGLPFRFEWDDLDAEGVRGVDVLRVAESARIQAVPEPTPGRVVKVVQAIVKLRGQDGEDRYLMQFDRHAGRYQPVGGKQEPDEADPRLSLRRELAEELGLDTPPGPDLCELIPVGEVWRTAISSPTYGILTGYTFTFFHVVNVHFPIWVDEDTCWMKRGEIVRGRADDGREISPIYLEALGLARLDELSVSLEE